MSDSIRLTLSRNKFTVIDCEDLHLVSGATLLYRPSRNTGYAYVSRPPGRPVLLHRLIMSPREDMQIDHINGDGLDNRRCNLRIVTHYENTLNQGMKSTNTSGFKGVSWEASRQRFRADINHLSKRTFLGYFSTAIDAAIAYDKAARELHGEFCRLNFPDVEAA